MKKILITGGNGFIGKNLIEGLRSEFNIHSPTHKELDLLNQNQVFKILDKYRYDFILHCATHDSTVTSTKDNNLVLENNLRMFLNLYRSKNLFGKMFYFGSGAEYSKEHCIPKMNENFFDTYVPGDSYGFSKYISAKLTENSINIFNLRLFGCFGKYEDWRIRFISNAICQAILGSTIIIKQNVYFDYLYISDLISIIRSLLSVKRLKHRTYNVCTGESIDLVSIARKIEKKSGKNITVKVKINGLNREYSGSNKRLVREVKNIEFTPVDKAISELYNWYEKNKDKLDINQLYKFS